VDGLRQNHKFRQSQQNWYRVLVIFDNRDLKDRWGWLLILESAKIGDKSSITSNDQTITGTFDIDPDGDLIRVRFISVETVPKVGENDQILSTKPSGRSFVQLI
jgi:hypothetical protein